MNLATAMMMVLEMLLVMTTLANVLARAMLLETSVTSAHQDTLDSHLANNVSAMPKDLAMTSVIPLVFAFVRTTLLETAVTIVLLDFSISQPVKIVCATLMVQLAKLVMLMVNVLVNMDSLETNVINAYLNITCLTMTVLNVNALLMDQSILIVMLRENVLAKSTFLETNVMNLNQDIITSLIPNLVSVIWKDLKTTLVMRMDNATANVTSRE